ncbi:hypothetical protein D9M68_856290 [compost metagenome]
MSDAVQPAFIKILRLSIQHTLFKCFDRDQLTLLAQFIPQPALQIIFIGTKLHIGGIAKLFRHIKEPHALLLTQFIFFVQVIFTSRLRLFGLLCIQGQWPCVQTHHHQYGTQ